ncbi:PadR family transcriptional regulator [Parafrankia discariae]|uniref:PadR family transcriptional regulator n=1 Tax=Parafrankia discariae TaxID=365528 RepID=UPI0005590249|nr:helix-turn-helix transcriptional regulator [Parafrankia discariae]
MGKRRQSGPRITLPTAAVLRLMLDNPTADYYGFDLAKASGFPSGTIYPILARLEVAGWLASYWEEGEPAELERPRRRMYRLTGHGATAARDAVATALGRLGVASSAIEPQVGIT